MTDKPEAGRDPAEQWYERRWRNAPDGSRSVVSVVLYLVTGLGGVLIAITADDAARRILWIVIGAVFLLLGATLLATLVSRSRRKP